METNSNDRVELENQRNLHDDRVKSALDAVVQNTEQSYPQFMSNFTQLLNDTVKIPNLNLSSQESHSSNFMSSNLEGHGASDLTHNVAQSVLPSYGENGVGKGQETGLEEEVLGYGDRPPSVLLRESSLTGNTVKLDNFIDDGNASDSGDSVPLEEGEWIELGGYQASFSPRNAGPEEGFLPVMKRDSTGTIIAIDPSEEESASSHSACPEHLELFPGEIEDIPTTPREDELQNITQLEIRTSIRESKAQNASDQSQEITGDDVRPFCLDADFDYDNVILTSKYTPAVTTDGIARQFVDVHLS